MVGWLPCTERIYNRAPFAVKTHRKARIWGHFIPCGGFGCLELCLYGIRGPDLAPWTLSWAVWGPGDGIVLIGGNKSPLTTEIVKQGGVVENSFQLRNPARYNSHYLIDCHFLHLLLRLVRRVASPYPARRRSSWLAWVRTACWTSSLSTTSMAGWRTWPGSMWAGPSTPAGASKRTTDIMLRSTCLYVWEIFIIYLKLLLKSVFLVEDTLSQVVSTLNTI